MAPVIWGHDLKEMRWRKFESSYMWTDEHHLRKTRFVVYQLALIFCVVSESLGTSALSDYVDSQKWVARRGDVYVYNNDYVAAASCNVLAGVFIACIFGAAFFLDLFWPERHESNGVLIAWKVGGILSVISWAASCFTLTIITATHCAHFSGAEAPRGPELLSQYPHDPTPICYRHNGRAIAAAAFQWPALLSVIGSCILLFYSIDHAGKGPGPKSAHARERDAANIEAGSSSETEKGRNSSIVPLEPAHDGVNRDAAADAPVAANATAR